MERITTINQYKIIQEKIDLIKVQIIKGKGFSEETSDRVKRDIKNALGEDMYIEVEIVDKIPREAGKARSVVSKIKIEW
jgi:phenylacetate-CoA ligase